MTNEGVCSNSTLDSTKSTYHSSSFLCLGTVNARSLITTREADIVYILSLLINCERYGFDRQTIVTTLIAPHFQHCIGAHEVSTLMPVHKKIRRIELCTVDSMTSA